MGRNRREYQRRQKFRRIILLEMIILLLLVGGFFAVRTVMNRSNNSNPIEENKNGSNKPDKDKQKEKELTPEEKAAIEEQERLQQEIVEREELIAKADRLVLGYDYDGAIELIKTYEGKEGGYEVYPNLVEAINKIEETKKSLVLYGGSYTTVKEFNHVFFHSMVADNSKAFDGDYDSKGYNMYMTTVYEFRKMMEEMYRKGYILISMHDMVKQEKGEDGTVKYVEQKIYLPEGKKPFVLSQDDTNYYDYMLDDGFPSRIVIDENGKITNEMVLDDGSKVYGAFDMVPIIDEMVEQYPDFSYKGAKGVIALTGYEGVLGYRTNDPSSPTYAQDVETAKKVAQAMKDTGWEFACHGWGHRDAYKITTSHFINDTQRWLDEVGSIIGETDIYIFPYGSDFETTMGHYSSEKYLFAKEKGFNIFNGVNKGPWMHIKDDYLRMTRRPLDGQAMLQFPERLTDLFDDLSTIIDPERPARDW